MNLNEQPLCKKKVLRSLRYFLYQPIYSSWYHNENSNIIKLILNELGVVKFRFAAAEIIRRLDQGEGISFSKLNQFYSEYIKDNTNRPTLYLHSNNLMIIYIATWTETVWGVL